MTRAPGHRSRLLCALALALACAGAPAEKGGRTVLLSEDDAPPAAEESAEAGEAAESEEAPESEPQERKPPPILVTRGDDRRAGAEVSKQVEAQMGLYEDEALAAYLQELGTGLARAVPPASRYRFKVVDQMVPNAFALPGGYIYVSRGLLALASSEDELANVVGHEITHSARRHAARQQAIAAAQPISMPWVRAANMAAYGRDMEREADKGGQRIAAASGYDPQGMATFMAKLGKSERLTRGYSRLASFYDTHPGTGERVSVNAVRAREIRWQRDPNRGDTRSSYLRRIDGLPLGDNPAAGTFQGRRFVHPGLDFQILFPSGWQTANTGNAVGATEPKGDAVVYLEAGPSETTREEAVRKLVAEIPGGAEPDISQPIGVAGFEAWRLEFSIPARGENVAAMVTLFDTGELTYRITAMARSGSAKRFRGRLIAVPRTFRRLTPEQTERIRVTRLRLVEARRDEMLTDLSRRSGNTWSVPQIAVLNGIQGNHRFAGGELVKIAREEAWTPEAEGGS